MNHEGFRAGPDWVMLGVPMDDGRVQLWASKDLSQADLDMARTLHDYAFKPWEYVPSAPTYVLTTRMGRIEAVIADTYGEALQILMQTWNPDTPTERLGLNAARSELNP